MHHGRVVWQRWEKARALRSDKIFVLFDLTAVVAPHIVRLCCKFRFQYCLLGLSSYLIEHLKESSSILDWFILHSSGISNHTFNCHTFWRQELGGRYTGGNHVLKLGLKPYFSIFAFHLCRLYFTIWLLQGIFQDIGRKFFFRRCTFELGFLNSGGRCHPHNLAIVFKLVRKKLALRHLVVVLLIKLWVVVELHIVVRVIFAFNDALSLFCSRRFQVKSANRQVASCFVSEPVSALLGPLFFTIHTIYSLSIFVFDFKYASGVLNSRSPVDHLNEVQSLLIGYFGVVSCHLNWFWSWRPIFNADGKNNIILFDKMFTI